MPADDPQSGDVYYYSYLWRRQFVGADPEKDRPCCVAIRLKKPFRGKTVFLLAISQSGTPEGGYGIEIPREEAQRIKRMPLDVKHWLTTSETNITHHASRSFHRSEYRGTFSPEFMRNVVMPEIRLMIEGEMARMKT